MEIISSAQVICTTGEYNWRVQLDYKNKRKCLEMPRNVDCRAMINRHFKMPRETGKGKKTQNSNHHTQTQTHMVTTTTN